MLSLIAKAFQNKLDTINSSSPDFNNFVLNFYESDELLYMDGKPVIPFTVGNAMRRTINEAHHDHFGLKYFTILLFSIS